MYEILWIACWLGGGKSPSLNPVDGLLDAIVMMVVETFERIVLFWLFLLRALLALHLF